MHVSESEGLSFSPFTMTVPSNISFVSTSPNTSVSQIKKTPGTPYKEASRFFSRALDERDYGLEDIPQIMSTIKFLEEKAVKLFQHEYDENKSSIVEAANYYLQNEKLQLEPLHSSFYPNLSYQDIEGLEPRDKQLVNNILRTAVITKLELPDFKSLVDKNASKEYSFQLWFGFGTDYEGNCKQLFNDCQMKK
jgi:hypothetical protein